MIVMLPKCFEAPIDYRTVYNRWTGLMDWTTGLTFYLEIDEMEYF